MNKVAIIFIAICMFCASLIMCIQNVQIENLQREIEKLHKADAGTKAKIEEVRQENKRYLDSCLDFILVLEEGKQE